MQIAPGIHSIPVASTGFRGAHGPNVYLVIGQEAAFIDSGYSNEATIRARLDYLKDIGNPKLSYILISHAHIDHVGGAERIKQVTGAKIITHPLEVEAANRSFSSTKVDEVMEDGTSLDLGGIQLKAIHSPGHSPGHLCIYVEDRKLLFSGDNILGIGTTAISPAYGDMAKYIDSLEKLLSYDIQMICPGHGPLIKEPKRKIQELIQHRREREEQVLFYLKQGKRTIEELAAEIYPELDRRLYEAAKGQVLAHLIKLERENRVERLDEKQQYAVK